MSTVEEKDNNDGSITSPTTNNIISKNEALFNDNRDEKIFNQIYDTLRSILNDVPSDVINTISIYSIGSIFNCINCNESIHISFSFDNELTEKEWKTIKNDDNYYVQEWIQTNNFDYYLYCDNKNRIWDIFFCSKCLLKLDECAICNKFDCNMELKRNSIKSPFHGSCCRRYHPLNKWFKCCGCQNDIYFIQKPAEYYYKEEFHCFTCNGYVCKPCAIHCYCDHGGYCTLRCSFKCFKFKHLFQHIFCETNATSFIDPYYLDDKRSHIDKIWFGNNVKYLESEWEELKNKMVNWNDNQLKKKFEQYTQQTDKEWDKKNDFHGKES